MSELGLSKCKKNDCTIDTDGKCLEGFSEVEECPNFFYNEQAQALEDDSSSGLLADSAEAESMIILPDGLGLSFSAAAKVTRANLTRVIVLAGAVGSGKTTLLSSIYERFQEDPFLGYKFAGSLSLIGFEQICHLSRVASGKVRPDTERTKQGSEKFLHLRVHSDNLEKHLQDLLFSDISGETFRLACESTEECQRLEFLKRADHLVLFIDGEKLALNNKRQEAFADADVLIRSCIEAGMIGNRTFLEVLFSKYDIFGEVKKDKQTAEFVQYIERTLRENYEDKLACLKFFKIAARPNQASKLESSYGLEDVFPFWVEGTPLYTQTRKYPAKQVDNIKREFDKYSIKQS